MKLSKTMGWLSLLFTFMSPVVVATDALADFQASFNASYEEVLATCEANGGDPLQIENGYGCIKVKCDGLSAVCTVECTDARYCTGTAPRSLRVRTSAATILGDCACVAGAPGADQTADANATNGPTSNSGNATTSTNTGTPAPGGNGNGGNGSGGQNGNGGSGGQGGNGGPGGNGGGSGPVIPPVPGSIIDQPSGGSTPLPPVTPPAQPPVEVPVD